MRQWKLLYCWYGSVEFSHFRLTVHNDEKALFHGRLRVFGEKMNTSVSPCSMFAAKTQDLVVLDHENLSNSTRVGWLDR
jgi:hypothetical protein